jgi:hypothetical protein
LCSSPTVVADGFFPSGDARYCLLVPAVGLFVDSFPEAQEIKFDMSNTVGYTREWIQGHTITDVSDIKAGRLHRFRDTATFIAGPPGTRIGIAAWFYNGSGHTIDIDEGRLYLNSPESGDLTRNNEVVTQNGQTSLIYFGNNFSRNGKYLSMSLPTIPPYSGQHSPGVQISSMVIKQPVTITNQSVSCFPTHNGQIVMQKYFVLKNNSLYHLPAVNVGNDFIDLNPVEEKQISIEETFLQNSQNNYVGSSILVSDTNEHLECAAIAVGEGDSLVPSARSFFVNRNDSGQSAWYRFQPAPAAEGGGLTLCVRQIGYTLTSSELSCRFELKQVLDVIANNKCEQEEAMSEVTVSIRNTVGYSDILPLSMYFDKEFLPDITSMTPLETKEIMDTEVRFTYTIPAIVHGGTSNSIFTLNYAKEALEKSIPLRIEYGGMQIQKDVKVESCQSELTETIIATPVVYPSISQEESLWGKTKIIDEPLLRKNLASAGIHVTREAYYLFYAVSIAVIFFLSLSIASKVYVRSRSRKTEERRAFSFSDNGQDNIESIER